MVEFALLALGIGAAGYFIGEGLKNFKNPDSVSKLKEWAIFEDHTLIPEKNVHDHLGISREDTTMLIEEHPDIPHVVINNNTYYTEEGLKEWLKKIGK